MEGTDGRWGSRIDTFPLRAGSLAVFSALARFLCSGTHGLPGPLACPVLFLHIRIPKLAASRVCRPPFFFLFFLSLCLSITLQLSGQRLKEHRARLTVVHFGGRAPPRRRRCRRFPSCTMSSSSW